MPKPPQERRNSACACSFQSPIWPLKPSPTGIQMSSGPRSALPHSASDSSERNKHDKAGNNGLGIRILDVPLLPQLWCSKWHKDQIDKPAKLTTSIGSSKTQESSRKTSTSALLTTPKHLTVWITTNCGKFFKRWEYQTTWLLTNLYKS